MADFTLDEDQRQIQGMMRRFAQEEFRKIARQCDEDARLPEDVLQKVWELGVCLNPIPEEYGGFDLGRSALTGSVMMEELAWGDVSLAMGALTPMLLMVPVLEFGTEEQKAHWLPRFCQESFLFSTAALMEPRVTFDPVDLHTTVSMEGDKLVLQGEKCCVPLADRAQHIVVYATSSRGGGPTAVEAVLVDRDTPGLKIAEREIYMGLRPLPLFKVTFDNCLVDPDRKIGGPNGIDYGRILNLSRTAMCSMAVGVARASLQYALNYAKERHAFGEPIASRQAIAFMLAEAAMEVDGMRLLTWRSAWRLDQGQDATRDATLAKRYCAEQTMKIVDYGVQILGGHGYIREHPVEMWFRNGRGFANLEGLAIL